MEEKEEKEEEKIPLCGEGIGQRPLRGRCPKKEKRKKEGVALNSRKREDLQREKVYLAHCTPNFKAKLRNDSRF